MNWIIGDKSLSKFEIKYLFLYPRVLKTDINPSERVCPFPIPSVKEDT